MRDNGVHPFPSNLRILKSKEIENDSDFFDRDGNLGCIEFSYFIICRLGCGCHVSIVLLKHHADAFADPKRHIVLSDHDRFSKR